MVQDIEPDLEAKTERRYERKKIALFIATCLIPLALHGIGYGILAPYAFAFLLVVTYAHIVDHEIDAAVKRVRGY